MNKEYTDNILKMWAEMNEYELIWDTVHVYPELIAVKDKDGDYAEEHVPPRIDHPFLFTIIKGLDEGQRKKYNNELSKVVPYFAVEIDMTISMLTASIEQILEALYNSRKETK